MNHIITREYVLEVIKQVEHPEIAATVGELGMILDVAVQDKIATVAIALPVLKIPEAVKAALIHRINQHLEKIELKFQMEYFEMTAEVRGKFYALARTNWKGSRP
ncbi:MAG: iron-sulfur cluster assembly protein [Calditrichia bacterium]